LIMNYNSFTKVFIRLFRLTGIFVMTLTMFMFAITYGPFPNSAMATIFERIFYPERAIGQYDRNVMDYESRTITINGHRMTVEGGQTTDSIPEIIHYYNRRYADQKPLMFSMSHPNLGVFAVLDRGPNPPPLTDIDLSTFERFMETGRVGDLGGMIKALVAFGNIHSGKTEIITTTLDKDFNLYDLVPEDGQVAPGPDLKNIPHCPGIRTLSFGMDDHMADIQVQMFKSFDSLHSVRQCYLQGMLAAGWEHLDIVQYMQNKTFQVTDTDILIFQNMHRFCYIALSYDYDERAVTTTIVTR
jgi:hypothetical protein